MTRASARIATFTNHYPLVGPTFWIISLQYFITQIVVAAGWPWPYSWLNNTISDLGATACNPSVCSPYAAWMNASFIVLGCTMIAGSALIHQEFKKSRASALGFIFMGLAGFGTIMVGLFPVTTGGSLHTLGAALPFLIGNLGLVVLGLALDLPRNLKYYTLLSGLIALIALPLFYSHTYLGIGQGGMERIVAYPQTIWLIVFGLYMSENRFRERQGQPSGL
jgi:hypothetical membrane protein